MAIQGKTTVASFFETGDTPTQAQFQDFIDSAAFLPSSGTGLLEIESTASSTTRAIGAFGVQIIGAAATASATSLLGVPEFSTAGKAIASAATTAAQRSLLGIASVPSNPDIVVLTGQIESPASGNYVLDQYAAFPYTVEWFARALVSGQCQITAQIEGANITGIVSASGNAAEAISSATGSNTVAVGNTLRLVVTDASSAGKLSFTLKGVRT